LATFYDELRECNVKHIKFDILSCLQIEKTVESIINLLPNFISSATYIEISFTGAK
jgi:hypothetical protein